jgi:hypothetical protein
MVCKIRVFGTRILREANGPDIAGNWLEFWAAWRGFLGGRVGLVFMEDFAVSWGFLLAGDVQRE